MGNETNEKDERQTLKETFIQKFAQKIPKKLIKPRRQQQHEQKHHQMTSSSNSIVGPTPASADINFHPSQQQTTFSGHSSGYSKSKPASFSIGSGSQANSVVSSGSYSDNTSGYGSYPGSATGSAPPVSNNNDGGNHLQNFGPAQLLLQLIQQSQQPQPQQHQPQFFQQWQGSAVPSSNFPQRHHHSQSSAHVHHLLAPHNASASAAATAKMVQQQQPIFTGNGLASAGNAGNLMNISSGTGQQLHQSSSAPYFNNSKNMINPSGVPNLAHSQPHATYQPSQASFSQIGTPGGNGQMLELFQAMMQSCQQQKQEQQVITPNSPDYKEDLMAQLMTIMHKLAEDAKLAEEKRSELQELEAKKRADEYNMMQIMMTLIRGIQEPDKPTSPPAALSCNTGFLNQGMFLNNNPTEILSSLLRLHPQVLQTQNPTYGMPKNEFPSSGAVKRRHSSTVSTVSMNSTSNYSPNFNDNSNDAQYGPSIAAPSQSTTPTIESLRALQLSPSYESAAVTSPTQAKNVTGTIISGNEKTPVAKKRRCNNTGNKNGRKNQRATSQQQQHNKFQDEVNAAAADALISFSSSFKRCDIQEKVEAMDTNAMGVGSEEEVQTNKQLPHTQLHDAAAILSLAKSINEASLPENKAETMRSPSVDSLGSEDSQCSNNQNAKEMHCEWGECTEMFNDFARFVIHVKQHVSQQSTFNCIWRSCRRDHPFSALYMLDQHVRKHSGEKPYACTFVLPTGEQCPKRYSRLENQKTHLRSHTGDRPYICTTCTRNFTNASDKAKHEKRTHGNIKDYKCPVDQCNKAYTDPSSLRKHVCNDHGPKVWKFAKQVKEENGSYGTIGIDQNGEPFIIAQEFRSFRRSTKKLENNPGTVEGKCVEVGVVRKNNLTSSSDEDKEIDVVNPTSSGIGLCNEIKFPPSPPKTINSSAASSSASSNSSSLANAVTMASQYQYQCQYSLTRHDPYNKMSGQGIGNTSSAKNVNSHCRKMHFVDHHEDSKTTNKVYTELTPVSYYTGTPNAMNGSISDTDYLAHSAYVGKHTKSSNYSSATPSPTIVERNICPQDPSQESSPRTATEYLNCSTRVFHPHVNGNNVNHANYASQNMSPIYTDERNLYKCRSLKQQHCHCCCDQQPQKSPQVEQRQLRWPKFPEHQMYPPESDDCLPRYNHNQHSLYHHQQQSNNSNAYYVPASSVVSSERASRCRSRSVTAEGNHFLAAPHEPYNMQGNPNSRMYHGNGNIVFIASEHSSAAAELSVYNNRKFVGHEDQTECENDANIGLNTQMHKLNIDHDHNPSG